MNSANKKAIQAFQPIPIWWVVNFKGCKNALWPRTSPTYSWRERDGISYPDVLKISHNFKRKPKQNLVNKNLHIFKMKATN